MQIGKIINQVLQLGSGVGTQTLRFFNGFNGDLQANHTATRTWVLPDKSGTIAMLSDVSSGGVASTYYESLAIAANNTVPNLTKTPSNSNFVVLHVNGVTYSPLFSHFTISGKTITWSSTNSEYTLLTTDKVLAQYETTE